METKLFELRDEGTFIPVLAVLMEPIGDPATDWLLRRAAMRALQGVKLGIGFALA